MAKKQEVAERQSNELAVSAAESEMLAAMDYSSTETKDLLIPKILLMQGSSKYVKEDAICKVGDIVNSTNGKVYGSVREKEYAPIRVVPIFQFKTWVKQEMIPQVGGKVKLQWVSTEPVTPENTNQKWQQEETNEMGQIKTFKLTKNVNYYVMLESDLGNPLAIPHVLTFRGTSSRSGQILEDWFARCKAAQMAKMIKDDAGNLMLPFSRLFEIGGAMEKNDEDQSWFVFKVKEHSPLKDEKTITTLFNWYKTVSKSSHKDVDNSDEKAPGTARGETDVM